MKRSIEPNFAEWIMTGCWRAPSAGPDTRAQPAGWVGTDDGPDLQPPPSTRIHRHEEHRFPADHDADDALTPDVRNRRLEELSARMRTVRRELNTCTDIETDAAALLLKWQEVRQAEKEEREVNENEQRRRSR